MNALSFLVTICDRNQARRFLSFYRSCGMEAAFVSLGRGTAVSEVLDAFGLEAAEKAVILLFVTEEDWKKVKKGLEREIQIDIPGSGIAFLVPLSSVGGKRQLQALLEGRTFNPGEESSLKDTKYELVVVIANQGHVDAIMDAAREAKARGGTVLSARGTGAERMEAFLGVSLATEKEIILMVTRREGKNAIMKAIMDKVGLQSEARSIVFSLPVTDTAGMRLVGEEESE